MLSKWKTLRRNFKLIDIFGNQISFSYNYNEIYKTYEGATMTVIIVLLLIVVTGIEFHNMIYRTESLVQGNVVYSDLSQDSSPFSFTSEQ
jgi:hypothetical protein